MDFYICLEVQFETMFPVRNPHISVAYLAKFPDMKSFYRFRMKAYVLINSVGSMKLKLLGAHLKWNISEESCIKTPTITTTANNKPATPAIQTTCVHKGLRS